VGLYLGPERSGIPWLLDPGSPELALLAPEIDRRGPETPCDADAAARDLDALPSLMRAQHFGVATGLIGFDETDKAIAAACDRILTDQPSTWGDAIGDLNDELRLALRDRHVGSTVRDPAASARTNRSPTSTSPRPRSM
jgi:hypothetical protein